MAMRRLARKWLRLRRKESRRPQRTLLRRIVRVVVVASLSLYALCAVLIAGLRWINPPFTMVQTQRRVESFFSKKPYEKRQVFVPLSRISPDLQHAVIAAEDGRFYQHWGIDWLELEKVIDESERRGRLRGASTISQQLAKNLFLTTSRSPIRKGLETALVPLEELFLSKQRILELYLNVIEWGPGVYGAEAAAQYHYGTAAAKLSRDQAARLAACIPNPLRRRPQRMDTYSSDILARMERMGW
jgi:monofunctional biosynthetic peptidoglycan transglycosylase